MTIYFAEMLCHLPTQHLTRLLTYVTKKQSLMRQARGDTQFATQGALHSAFAIAPILINSKTRCYGAFSLRLLRLRRVEAALFAALLAILALASESLIA